MKYSILFLFILTYSCAALKDPPKTITLNDLDAQLDSLYNSSLLPGVGLMGIKGDSVIYAKNMGNADWESERPYTENTVQTIGSISKTILAVALMKAVELELLDLDEDISNYVSFQIRNPHFPDQAITLRHLATHSSGIIDKEDVYVRSYYFENANQIDFSEFPKLVEKRNILALKKNKLIDDSEYIENCLSPQGVWYSDEMFSKNTPGEKFQYTNIGAALVGYIIERVSGIQYEDFVQQHIFEPLGMNNTYWDFNQVPSGYLATKYYSRTVPIPNYYLITKADGGIYTSTYDLSKFLIDIRNGIKGNGKLLKPQSYKSMLTRTQIGNEYGGIFWGVDEDGVVNHNGGDPGLLTMFAHNPKRDMSYILFTNCSAEMDKKLWQPLRNMIITLVNHKFDEE